MQAQQQKPQSAGSPSPSAMEAQPQSSGSGSAQQMQTYQPQQQSQMVVQSQNTMMMAQPGMMMYQECRSNARIIAYIDIVCTILGVIAFIVVVALLVGGLQALQHIKQQDRSESEFSEIRREAADAIAIYFYVLMFMNVIALITFIIDICIACGLLSAADLNTAPFEAIKKAGCWRNYNIFLLIWSFITGCLNSQIEFPLGYCHFWWFVLRIICVIIVSRFMDELRMQGNQVGVGIGMTTSTMGAQQMGMPYGTNTMQPQQPYQQQYQQQPYQQPQQQYQQQPQQQYQQQYQQPQQYQQ